MTMCRVFLMIIYIVLLISLQSVYCGVLDDSSVSSGLTNYLVTDDLSDGEHELRLHFEGVSAKQTSVGPSEGSLSGLVVREVSDGKEILYLIYTGLLNVSLSSGPLKDYSGLQLKECDLENDPALVKTFLSQFAEDVEQALDTEARDVMQDNDIDSSDLTTVTWDSVSYTRLGSRDDIPHHFRHLVNFRSLRKSCRRHTRATKKAMKYAKRFDTELTVDAVETTPSRSRRAINDFFILPGTLWCGNENRASNQLELSGYMDADACCRIHDRCPYNIDGLSTKFGLFNSNLVTMSHCACDKRFRTCLKASNNGASNLVGRIFFDMVGTECFVFKKEKVCKMRSWFGTCQKFSIERRASLMAPKPWTKPRKKRYTNPKRFGNF